MNRIPTPWSAWRALVLLLLVSSFRFTLLTRLPALELEDGERITLVGSTFLEREGTYGYIEALLAARYPGKRLEVRNVAWSGDNVRGRARAQFDPPEVGFQRLLEQVGATRPTRIVVGYGLVESFEGEAGLARFEEDLATLLDQLGKLGAKLILLSPPAHASLGQPYPDPAAHNAALALYSAAIERAAKARGLPFVDLFAAWSARLAREEGEVARLTENGIHLTPRGHWEAAHDLLEALGASLAPWEVSIDAAKAAVSARGTKLEGTSLSSTHIAFHALDETLPAPPRPGGGAPMRRLIVGGLRPGRYILEIDGEEVAAGTGAEWAVGVALEHGPWIEHAERLRKAIVARNDLYFHRWRPQNDTYILGFRKHEQGKNARELPLFDPLVAAKDSEVAALSVPASHAFALVPEPDPAREIEDLQVAEGFEVNVFAASPMAPKPIQMNFDADGRLWIVSSPVYPQILPGAEATDRVIILEDSDGDGEADRSTVFADNLLIPTGIAPGDGGAYVANSTEILHLRDTDGDGRADERRVVLSGFGIEDTHHIIHTFRWGPDGLLYFNQSIYIHSHVETPWGVRRLDGGGIWQWNPDNDKLEVYVHGMCNPWGHQFDRWGQSFGADGAYGDGVLYLIPGATVIGTPTSKRELRGLNLGSPKYCGAELLSGRHLPQDWRGTFVTCDFRANRVCRFQITEDGAGFAAKQLPDVARSRNVAFRPIDLKMGPDGALYMADWYNPIIQHGEVDFRSPLRNKSHGRIWRLTAKGRPLLPRPKLVGASIAELLDRLKEPEDWTRLQAKRVLKSRPRGEVLAVLRAWIAGLDPGDAEMEHHELEALWVFQSFDEVDGAHLSRVLEAKDPRARAAAVRVLGHWIQRIDGSAERLASLVADPHPRVRLEAVRALSRVGTTAAMSAALRALDAPLDASLDYALHVTANELEPRWIEALEEGAWSPPPAQLAFALRAVGDARVMSQLRKLAETETTRPDRAREALALIAAQGSPDDLAFVLAWAVELCRNGEVARPLLEGLQSAQETRSVAPTGSRVALASIFDSPRDDDAALALRLAGLWGLKELRPRLEATALDGALSGERRKAAAEALGGLGEGSRSALLQLLAAAQPFAIQARALSALARIDAMAAATATAALLQALPPEGDMASIFAPLFSRRGGAELLVEALEGRSLDADTAKLALRAVRRQGQSQSLGSLEAALRKAGGLGEQREEWPDEELARLTVEVRSDGDATRGEAIFRRKELSCFQCHSIGGAGGSVGPDLTSIGTVAQVDYLLESVLTPSKAIKENYHAITLVTDAGEVITGIKVRETGDTVTLRNAEGAEVPVPRGAITEESPGGSLMPQGLSDELTRDELRDLVRFLSELGKAARVDPALRIVRRWHVLEDVPDRLAAGRPEVLSGLFGGGTLRWVPAYSNVRGELPLAELPRAERRSIAFVQTEMLVSKAGDTTLVVNGVEGLGLWYDTTYTPLSGESTLHLEPGRHRITFRVELRGRKADLRCELREAPGSGARFELQ